MKPQINIQIFYFLIEEMVMSKKNKNITHYNLEK